METLCRVCMEKSEDLISIFEITEKGEKTFSEMLVDCTKCQVDKLDTLPKNMCLKCSVDVQKAFAFKEKAEKSHKQFIRLSDEGLPIEFKHVSREKDLSKMEKCTQTENNDNMPKMRNDDELPLFQKVTLERITCPICYRTFSRKDHAKEHIFKVHKEKPNKYFQTLRGFKLQNLECPICGRKFKRKSHLMRHITLVHKEDPNSVLMNVNHAEKKSEEQIITNDEEESNKSFIEDILENSDSAAKRVLVYLSEDSKINELIKGELKDETNNLEGKSTEKIIFKTEPSHFYDFENEDISHENGNFQEPTLNAQIEDNSIPSSNDNDSESLLSIKNSIDKNRCVKGIGTPEERTCQICQRLFSRTCHLRRHMRSAHTQEKPHSCSHCEKCFSRSDLLKNHIRGVHSAKTLKCDLCEKTFSRKEALERHKKTPHGVASEISFDCELCERTFSQKRFLMRHQLLHSNRIFACRYCEETFKDRKLFNVHERGHKSIKKDFLCSICGESFARIDYLRIHVQRHLGEKPHKCQYCEKSFIRKSDLNEHERYHTNTRPNVCRVCGKGFVRRSKLTIHMRIHTGEKPYKCEHCPKSFAQRNDLKAHIRRHTGERFSCDQCDATFLQLYGLRQHALNAHGRQIESTTGRLEKVNASLLEKV